ncbi:AMP-binding enzyme, partial [Nocardia farcinica]|uniref:AMP-binding enzyme n=1 Tax=Nocardia farcinica TaxID=37329 RepID=UPI003CC7CF87
HRIVGRESVHHIKPGGTRWGGGVGYPAVRAHPGGAAAAVGGRADDDLGQRVVAFVVARAGHDQDDLPTTLIGHVADQLSVHKRPREVRVVDSLPRNAMGKVQKKALSAGG